MVCHCREMNRWDPNTREAQRPLDCQQNEGEGEGALPRERLRTVDGFFCCEVGDTSSLKGEDGRRVGLLRKELRGWK